MNRPTVVLAEDDSLIREGCLVPALESEFEIVAAVDDGNAAVAAVAEHGPDVVLLDISLPGLRGFAAARQILACRPETKVLFVSNYNNPEYLEEALNMGASGYVLKSRAAAELLTAIRTALAGQFYRTTL